MEYILPVSAVAKVSIFVLILCQNTTVAGDKTDTHSEPSPKSSSPHIITSSQATNYIWPTYGVVTSGFGQRFDEMHKGVDIAGAIGNPIFATETGVVIFAGKSSKNLGNVVMIRHNDGNVSLYAHNQAILVRKGQQVQKGQQISVMGITGYTTGPHLHFEIHSQEGSPVDPRTVLSTKQPPLTLSQMTGTP